MQSRELSRCIDPFAARYEEAYVAKQINQNELFVKCWNGL